MSQLIRVGLDFGSVQYRAAYITDGKIIPVPIGDDIIWSGNIILLQTEKDFSFASLKRQMGTGFTVSLAGGKESVEDLILHSLQGIKQKIEEYTGGDIGHLTISVPARYSAFRRAEIVRIAESAGFGKTSLINDSTAAALAYKFDREESSTLLIYSMGYMGYEISLLRAAKQNLREIAHEGDDSPAGMDFDYVMINACIELLRQELLLRENMPRPLRIYKEHLLEISNQVSEIKQQLSVEETATGVLSDYNFGIPIALTFTRSLFEELIASRVQTTMESVDRILEEASMQYADIDKVLLIGGSTHINYIQRQLENRFGPKLIQPRDDMLARGAAIQADKTHDTELALLSPSITPVKQAEGREVASTFFTASKTGPLETKPTPSGDYLEALPASDELRGIAQANSSQHKEITELEIESLFGRVRALIHAGNYQHVDELLTFLAIKVEDARKVLDQSRQGQ